MMEAGFPIASPGDLEATRAVAREIKALPRSGSGPGLSGRRGSRTARTGARCKAASAHVPGHVRFAPEAQAAHISREEALSRIIGHDSVRSPALRGSGIFGGRRQPQRYRLSVRGGPGCRGSGRDRSSICRTRWAIPPRHEYAANVPHRRANTSSIIRRSCLSAHCHDDLGLAVANSLAAIEAGVRQIECTINGIGERAGNAALEELAVALHIRQNFYAGEYKSAP